jgi:hypothetical protein
MPNSGGCYQSCGLPQQVAIFSYSLQNSGLTYVSSKIKNNKNNNISLSEYIL